MKRDMIRDYAIYLRNELVKFNGGKGNVYLRLQQFIVEGRMKDGIGPKSTDNTKIRVLEEMGRNIAFFLMNQHKLFNDEGRALIMSYEEFSVPRNRDNKLNDLGI